MTRTYATRYTLVALLISCAAHVQAMQQELPEHPRVGEYADRYDPPREYQPHVAAMLGGALGDALGRVTEFKKMLSTIFNNYPNGCCSFEDFTDYDWRGLPEALAAQHIAPYTDDTRMALVVAKALLSGVHRGRSRDEAMQSMACMLIDDMNKADGWAANYRAPGGACLRGITTVESRLQEKRPPRNWWLGGDSDAGGCGSVMRAHPLLFDADRATEWSLEHSKITHGHAMALAACAAMAWGTARARTVNPYQAAGDGQELTRQAAHEIVDAIIEGMTDTAYPYDRNTAEKIRDAHRLAQEARERLTPFDFNIYRALQDSGFRAFHKRVFDKFQGWQADDAVAAASYCWALFPTNIRSAVHISVHTPGDSDSIASMAGALAGALGGNIDQLHPALLAHLEERRVATHRSQNE